MAESDPLAVDIFVSRRQNRNMPDTKSGKRNETAAQMSWQATDQVRRCDVRTSTCSAAAKRQGSKEGGL